MNLGCLGSDNAERSYQPRLIALPIVPDYLVKFSKSLSAEAHRAKAEQLNILQTVVSTDQTSNAAFLRALRFVFPPAFARGTENEVMVKPHG